MNVGQYSFDFKNNNYIMLYYVLYKPPQIQSNILGSKHVYCIDKRENS